MKSIALFYGNCQAGTLTYALAKYPEFAQLFEARCVPNFQHPTEQVHDLSDEDTARCRLVFAQVDVRAPLPASVRERLPNSTVIVRFPPLDFNLLWPFHVKDPRNVSVPGFPFGKYPYGDRIVVALLQQGLIGDALWAAYQVQSVTKMPNLDRLCQLEEERLATRDEAADVRVLSIVQEALRERPIFATLNHPNGWLLGRMWGAMIEEARRRLGLSQQTQAITERVFQSWDPLGALEVPIHPEVAKYLDLRWWTPEYKYRSPVGMQTWEEYMRRYIDWC